jgi:hypothetical protein
MLRAPVIAAGARSSRPVVYRLEPYRSEERGDAAYACSMSKLWHCYTWQGPADMPKGDAEPVEDWSTPEGAVEFLRRELAAHGMYSKPDLIAALADLRRGDGVTISRELADGGHLHLEVTPEPV